MASWGAVGRQLVASAASRCSWACCVWPRSGSATNVGMRGSSPSVLMAAAGLLLLVGGRFEMVRGLRGDGRDEYWERMDVHASYLRRHGHDRRRSSALCLWEWANGRSRDALRTSSASISGVAYIARARAPAAQERAGSRSWVGAPPRGRNSRHVHCSGSLSARKRRKLRAVADAVSLRPCRSGPRPRARA